VRQKSGQRIYKIKIFICGQLSFSQPYRDCNPVVISWLLFDGIDATSPQFPNITLKADARVDFSSPLVTSTTGMECEAADATAAICEEQLKEMMNLSSHADYDSDLLRRCNNDTTLHKKHVFVELTQTWLIACHKTF
jgi:hypothetical protein